MPIEVFAPSLRMLRSSKYWQEFDINHLRQPFLTVHAGEDFSHVVSGLRAIDEAVTFCRFASGDRIGHGLALGIDVESWAQKHHFIYLPAGEHLDNLVWCYIKAVEVSQYLPEMHSGVCLLENKIAYWSKYVYGKKHNPQDLHKAWLFRRNCPNLYDALRNDYLTEIHNRLPDLEDMQKDVSKKAIALWKHYLHSGLLRNSNYHKVIEIKLIDSLKTTHLYPNFENGNGSLSTAELKMIEAIQDFLIERYTQKQIIIEACPTSNLFIGDLNQYKEYPIFRWNPPGVNWLNIGEKYNRFGLRRGAAKVCINTDDSGLMPTTIENEHNVLRDIAVNEYNVSQAMADSWIRSIRENGVELFKANHTSPKNDLI